MSSLSLPTHRACMSASTGGLEGIAVNRENHAIPAREVRRAGIAWHYRLLCKDAGRSMGVIYCSEGMFE